MFSSHRNIEGMTTTSKDCLNQMYSLPQSYIKVIVIYLHFVDDTAEIRPCVHRNTCVFHKKVIALLLSEQNNVMKLNKAVMGF